MSAWRIDYRPSPDLPPLAWVARVSYPNVVVACGQSVRQQHDAFFDGSWVGPPGLSNALTTTPFGAGMVVRDGELFVVPAGHTCEGVFMCSAFDRRDIRGQLDRRRSRGDRAELVKGMDYVSRMIKLAEGLEFIRSSRPRAARRSNSTISKTCASISAAT